MPSGQTCHCLAGGQYRQVTLPDMLELRTKIGKCEQLGDNGHCPRPMRVFDLITKMIMPRSVDCGYRSFPFSLLPAVQSGEPLVIHARHS